MKDIYVYEGTYVLINKLEIKDPKLLDEKEGAIVSLNLINLLKHPFTIKSVFDIKKIHSFIFKDLYQWAGENRKINMYKEEPVLNGLSVNYSDYKNIDSDLNKLDLLYKSIKWKELSKEDLINQFVILISRLWRIHCFREGNTRTVTTFLYLLMKQLGIKINIDFIGKNAKYFRNALVLASIDQYSEYEHLTKIINDSTSEEISNDKKYKTIKEYKVDNYEYRNHKYKD